MSRDLDASCAEGMARAMARGVDPATYNNYRTPGANFQQPYRGSNTSCSILGFLIIAAFLVIVGGLIIFVATGLKCEISEALGDPCIPYWAEQLYQAIP